MDAFITDTVTAVRPATGPDHNKTLFELARPLLGNLRREFEQAASGDLGAYPQLHQVRIAGKRLRYAMEVLADCFPESFRGELYPLVEKMQEILGRANDSHVAGQRLAELRDRLKRYWPQGWKRLQPGIEGMLRYHNRRLPQERRRFHLWWANWCKHGSERLLELLAAPVCR
jgi:CHAD domain-containing protein